MTVRERKEKERLRNALAKERQAMLLRATSACLVVAGSTSVNVLSGASNADSSNVVMSSTSAIGVSTLAFDISIVTASTPPLSFANPSSNSRIRRVKRNRKINDSYSSAMRLHRQAGGRSTPDAADRQNIAVSEPLIPTPTFASTIRKSSRIAARQAAAENQREFVEPLCCTSIKTTRFDALCCSHPFC